MEFLPFEVRDFRGSLVAAFVNKGHAQKFADEAGIENRRSGGYSLTLIELRVDIVSKEVRQS